MRLVLDAEQQQLQSVVRTMLATHAPAQRVREVIAEGDGYDRPLWKRLAGEMGLTGLVIPERYGGSGAGQVERSVVLEELGRTLAPVPYFASAVLAVDTVLALDDTDLQAELLPKLATGDAIATVALAGADGEWGSAPASVNATRRDDSWLLDGEASFVVAGESANVLLVYATTPTGPGWFVVAGNASGLQRTALRTLDPTRGLARLSFQATPARRAETADAEAVLEKLHDQACVALAAEQLGGMGWVLETTVQYAKVRVQFGRAIGSYQSVKHACADLYCTYEQAGALLRYAAWTADHEPETLPLAATTAQIYLAPAYFDSAAHGIQLHGGIGYTWEHDAHLYYKRAKSSELLLGDGGRHSDRLADILMN
jgi:alkylation response protein AidB-like acyl-CoA dehydrogenase